MPNDKLSQPGSAAGAQSALQARRERAAQALRENLRRRKAQAEARRAPGKAAESKHPR